MLVYGDHRDVRDASECLGRIFDRLRAIAAMPAGMERHAKLVGALVEAGQLQQGIEDKGWPDASTSALVHGLARCVVRSLDSAYGDIGTLPAMQQPPLPARVEIALPEGFAFYALYPESYVEAARKLRLSAPPRVIGLRSIGTTLGAIVAATLDAPPALTVRPIGHPFARQVDLPGDVLGGGAHYVIVDEGPGLSGSSFGSVADWLEERGVPSDRIAFLPSHSGDLGPEASARHRRRWNRVQRIAAELDPGFLERRFGPLERFATGSPFERCKFFARAGGKRLLLKFAGLGPIGERKLAIARALSSAGLAPEPLGLVHGFLVERWYENATKLTSLEKPVEEIGRYIGARARLFTSPKASGASIGELARMCRRNLQHVLGEASSERLDQILEECATDDLEARVNRVVSDNKLDPSEWLRLENGRLIKTDALDHHQAHDIIGCQGIEWDIAGAIEEFDLDRSEASLLIEATGACADATLLRFYRLAYPAFRLGQAEVGGMIDHRDRYAASVGLVLDQVFAERESRKILV